MLTEQDEQVSQLALDFGMLGTEDRAGQKMFD